MVGVALELVMLASADPVVLPARLFQMMQFFSVGEQVVFCIAPPPVVALLPEKVQFVMVGLEEKLYIPPPTAEAELPEKEQFFKMTSAPE